MKIADLFVKLGLKSRDYEQGIDRAQKKTSKFSAVVKKIGGFIAGAFAVTAIVNFARKTVAMINEFEQSTATLAATMGKTQKEINNLIKQSKDLGRSTMFTASQVSALQNELAKLGFSKNEIENSAEAILNLAAATGTELAASASIAGSALRAFNLDAEEMDRVSSVLAVSTTKSALSMGDFAVAMSTVAPVAKAFNFQIEDVTALLGKLKDAGFDASSAGTATRNILLNLADSGGALAKALGGPVRSFDELIPALITLREKGVDLNEMLQVTDKRSVAAFSQFLSGAEKARELRDALIDVNDELQDMVDTKTDTVTGALDRLNSAWQGLMLNAGKSSGFLKRNLDALANQLNIIQTSALTTGEKFAAFLDPAGFFSGGYSGAVQKMNEVAEKQKAETERFNNLTKEQLQELADAARAAYVKAFHAGNMDAATDFAKQSKKARDRIKELTEETKNLNNTNDETFTSVSERITELQNKINTLTDSISADMDFKAALKIKEQVSAAKEELSALQSMLPMVGVSMPAMTGQAGTPQIAGEAPLPGGLADMSGFLERNAALTKRYTNEMLGDWENFSSQLKIIAEDEIANSIANVAESLGQLAAGQINLQGFFNSVISQLGNFLKTIGKMFIMYGVAQSAFFKSLAAGPAGAVTLIAAGAALVAIGGAISSVGQRASSGSLGGGASSGGQRIFDASDFPTGEQGVNINVQGVLQGDNILISNQRSGYRRRVVG